MSFYPIQTRGLGGGGGTSALVEGTLNAPAANLHKQLSAMVWKLSALEVLAERPRTSVNRPQKSNSSSCKLK